MVTSLTGHAHEAAFRSLIVSLGPKFPSVLHAALDRMPLINVDAVIVSGQHIDCDFTQPENLKRVDDIIIPFVQNMLKSAEIMEMTAITGLYASPILQYALKNGVQRHNSLEIIALLGAQGKPATRVVSSTSNVMHVKFGPS